MGWAMMIVIGVGAAGLLLALGVRRGMWSAVGAALMVGAIGYAAQGSPVLPAHPVAANADDIAIDPGIIDLRSAIFGQYGDDATYLTASDGLQRAGDVDDAAHVLLSAINHDGGDAALWTELGTVISTHDGGYVSPAAVLAFNHAAKLAPTSPGPPFFQGLADVRAGDFASARPLWDKALALTPDGADYKPQLAVRLELLDRYLALAGQQQ